MRHWCIADRRARYAGRRSLRESLRRKECGRRQRWFALLLAIVTAWTLAACSGEDDGFIESKRKDAATRLTLALREGTYSDVIVGCLPAFEEAHDIAVDVYELSEDDLHALVAGDAANASGAYDLCMVDGSWMAEYTANGVLANLSDYDYALDEDIIPATTEICYRDGDVYLAPYYGNVTVLLYNKDIIKRAGYEPDEIDSLEDMMEICRFAEKSHNLGFMYRGDSANNYVVDFLPILLSYGGWVVDEDNRPTVDTPECRAAMNFYLDLIATGDKAERDELVIAIANNAAAMGIGWPGWYTPEKNSTADYVAITGKTGGDHPAYNANVYGVWTIGVPANSTHTEDAVALLSYLMDKDVQRSTVAGGGVPCRYSSLRDPEVLADFPQYEVVCKALESGVYRPILEEWSEFYTILGAHMEAIVEGEETVDAGLTGAQQELTTLLQAK